ncbi:MAG: OsmC family protein [Polyangiaceae bacterium]|nr:OsmC family protein [Polyangiaceae bacterium]
MKLNLSWQDRMVFVAAAAGCETKMDAKAPIGQGSALTPKELVLAGLGGCTAMDVIALMRKHKQKVTRFDVKVDASVSQGGHPVVFTAATLTFELDGEVDPSVALEAVKLSQTKYCGVSTMLSKAFPIRWELVVNGTSAGQGQAEFG